MRNVRFVPACAILLVFTGCTPSPAPLPTVEALAPAERDELIQQQLDGAWKVVLSSDPDAERPQVEIIRLVSEEEWAQTNYDCLENTGLTNIFLNESGGVGWDNVPTDQRPIYEMARYVCTAQFPLDPKYVVPFNDSQLRYLYEYRSEDLTSCLTAEGQSISAPPSLQSFMDDGGAWTPYADVVVSSQEHWGALKRICPEFPTGLYGE